jgi:hypothetical protein
LRNWLRCCLILQVGWWLIWLDFFGVRDFFEIYQNE